MNGLFDRSSGLLLGTDSHNIVNICTIIRNVNCFSLALYFSGNPTSSEFPSCLFPFEILGISSQLPCHIIHSSSHTFHLYSFLVLHKKWTLILPFNLQLLIFRQAIRTHKSHHATPLSRLTLKCWNHRHGNIKLAQTEVLQDAVKCKRRHSNIELFRELYSGIREDCHVYMAKVSFVIIVRTKRHTEKYLGWRILN
jgi:hypothetical protein